MLNLEEAATYLGVSKTSLRRWTNSGALECRRLGARAERRFERTMLDAFLFKQSGTRATSADAGFKEKLSGAAQDGRHKHVSLYFRDADQQWRSFRRYFLDHYHAGKPTTYLYSSSTRAELYDRIAAEGIDPEAAGRAGLLSLVPAKEAYLRQGVFSASFMISFMKLLLILRRSDGHLEHLVTGEMDWYFTETPGTEEIHLYEERLNTLLDQNPQVTIVCQYDITKFSGEDVFNSCRSHPIVQFDDQIRVGFFDPSVRLAP